MDKSEVLVHISAPSGAADDARYRAQVEAILNFQTHSREAITARGDEPSSLSLSSQDLEATENANPSLPRSEFPAPRASKRHVSQNDSLETPVSVIPDSQPEQLAPGPTFDAEGLSLIPEDPTDSPRSAKRARVDDVTQHSAVQDETTEDRDSTTAQPTSAATNTPIIASKEKEEIEHQEEPTNPGPEPEPTHHLTLPLEIKPSPPPISNTALYTTHITPTLEMLSKRLRSPRTFNPVFQSRDLDALERGYWYLRINLVLVKAENEGRDKGSTQSRSDSRATATAWDKPLFNRFWTFLKDFIEKERRAGWGVWCILEAAEAAQAQREPSSDAAANAAKTTKSPTPAPQHAEQPVSVPLELRVYAWGEIATHVYLLLFLAGERRVRGMGAQWRDARDEVVIQMPGTGSGS